MFRLLIKPSSGCRRFCLYITPSYTILYSLTMAKLEAETCSCFRLSIWNLRLALFCDITQRRMAILYRRFGTTYRSHFQGSRSSRRKRLLGPWRWDRYVVLKRRYRIIIRGCVTPQKSANFISIAAQAWNRGYMTHILCPNGIYWLFIENLFFVEDRTPIPRWSSSQPGYCNSFQILYALLMLTFELKKPG
jgi:hypothetical protein